MARNKAAKAAQEELDVRVYQARLQGTSFRAIAANFNRPLGTISEAFRRELKRVSQATTATRDQNIAEAISRHDRLIEIHNAMLRQIVADPTKRELFVKITQELRKVEEQRAKLLGLFAPDKILVPVPAASDTADALDDQDVAVVVDQARNWEPPTVRVAVAIEGAVEDRE